jgi:hypothetical protein
MRMVRLTKLDPKMMDWVGERARCWDTQSGWQDELSSFSCLSISLWVSDLIEPFICTHRMGTQSFLAKKSAIGQLGSALPFAVTVWAGTQRTQKLRIISAIKFELSGQSVCFVATTGQSVCFVATTGRDCECGSRRLKEGCELGCAGERTREALDPAMNLVGKPAGAAHPGTLLGQAGLGARVGHGS